jgi:hypothetical protein
VTDSFGDEWTLAAPSDGSTRFATEGLDVSSLVVWAKASTPPAGPAIDDG